MTLSADWSRLFVLEAPRLKRFLRRFGPSISAEDITQDSFAQLCAADPETITSPRGYLYRTAKNLALNEARRARIVAIEPIADPDALPGSTSAPSPEDQIVAADELRRLEQILAEMPAKQRQALLFCRIEGLSYKEIGDRLGVSPRTVERYVADAIAYCHLALRGEAGEE